MVKFVSGDLLESCCDYLVNTVNCEGIMGKGIALQFKKKYPEMFDEYVLQCQKNQIEIGKPHLWSLNNLFENITIINFPTKISWRNPSKIEYIEDGLTWMKKYFITKPYVSCAIPPLGCGNGNLEWNKVKSIIYKELHQLKTTFYVYEPGGVKMNQWGF